MKFTQIATAIALGLALSTAAQAATQVSQFNVKITITGTCAANSFPNAALGAASDLDFNSQASATGAVNLLRSTPAAAAHLTVQCTKGTAVTVGLVPANSSTSGAGTMTGAILGNTDTIAYQLIQPTASGSPAVYAAGVAGGTAWGSGTNALSVVGQGMTVGIKLPVTATITAANALDVAADSYNEVVTATLTY